MSSLAIEQLVALIDGRVVRGKPGLKIEGVASLTDAGPADLTFLGNKKYHKQFEATRAGVVIVPPGEHGGPAGAVLLEADNPSFAFAQVVKHFTAALERKFQPGIHPRAIVEDSAVLDPTKVRVHAGAVIMAGARVGDGSEIGPNAVIGEKAVIGADCLIHANVTVCQRCVLGDRVILQPGAVIGSDGFGYETVRGRHVKIDQVGIVELQDDVEIGANTTIDRARFGRTVVGRGTKIDNLVQIGHNSKIGEHNLFAGLTGIAGSTTTGDYVICAGQVGIGGHLHIGDKAILSARCGTVASLDGGITYAGELAQPLREDLKQKAYIRRLPEIYERLRELEKKMDE